METFRASTDRNFMEVLNGGLEAANEAENGHGFTHMFESDLFLAGSAACLCYPPCFPSSRLFGITLGAGGKLRFKCV